ncbi:hypothetical protein DSO57_1037237 [Entomophthora muscae]|uniref:Uncharacterized protein n=1 Tax=Entomophthora muscae TaxID=34485 RepID=A0ACC2TKY3_9FUNG|nr:hypothetical protein DSO57_1037237 [Entomophthora muscae]
MGGFGVVFFPLRNSMIQDEIEKLKQKKMPPSLRKDAAELYSSLVAGSATGGLAGIFKAGPYAIVPGMVLFGIGAGLIQGTCTALYRYRQDLLMDKSKPKAEARPPSWWLDVIVALLPDWFKVSKIPDDEYAAMLEANLNQLNALLESAEESLEDVNSALAKEAANRKVIPLSEKR